MSRWAANQGYIFFNTAGKGTPPCTGFLLQEDGFKLLQENGDAILIASECPPGALLTQGDDAILQENGYKILQ